MFSQATLTAAMRRGCVTTSTALHQAGPTEQAWQLGGLASPWRPFERRHSVAANSVEDGFGVRLDGQGDLAHRPRALAQGGG